MIAAIVPAAGKSERFGQNKLVLKLGNRTALEHVLTALLEGGVSDILVVLGPANACLTALVQKANGTALVLDRATSHMRETIEAGLSWLASHRQPLPEGWMVCPADYPAVAPTVVRQLIRVFSCGPRDAVVVPTYQGVRGHPVLLSWSHAERLPQFDQSAGLNTYIRQQLVIEVPVETPGILWDLDHPEDQARILGYLETRQS